MTLVHADDNDLRWSFTYDGRKWGTDAYGAMLCPTDRAELPDRGDATRIVDSWLAKDPCPLTLVPLPLPLPRLGLNVATGFGDAGFVEVRVYRRDDDGRIVAVNADYMNAVEQSARGAVRWEQRGDAVIAWDAEGFAGVVMPIADRLSGDEVPA